MKRVDQITIECGKLWVHLLISQDLCQIWICAKRESHQFTWQLLKKKNLNRVGRLPRAMSQIYLIWSTSEYCLIWPRSVPELQYNVGPKAGCATPKPVDEERCRVVIRTRQEVLCCSVCRQRMQRTALIESWERDRAHMDSWTCRHCSTGALLHGRDPGNGSH